MDTNNINPSLPSKIVLEQYTNEVKGIIARIEVNMFLLERQTTFNDVGKQSKKNIEALLADLKRAAQLAEEYVKM